MELHALVLDLRMAETVMPASTAFGSRFKRDRLPRPEDYYANEGLKLLGSGAWRSALCPFHNDLRPSLRVFVQTGAFRCMACGAHGGDVLAFERLRTGKSFADAARDLGAWG